MTDNNQLGGVKQNLDYNASYTLKDPDHDEIKDGYQLRWVGKDYAKLQENLLPETVIVPDSEHNAKEHNKDSQNLFLTGDNLEVLKHLEHAYTGQVDMIYIDPPYNTGSDGFVYSDNFRFTDQQLRDTLGLTEEEVQRVKNIYGKASHSAWLTFMYPRLKLAKKLLKDTGVIFVSIDDNEQANLKLMMDEIFQNTFIGSIAWKKTSGDNSTSFAFTHDQILVYVKSGNSIPKSVLTPEQLQQYSNPDNDPNGDWAESDYRSKWTKSERPNLYYGIEHPHTGELIYPDTYSSSPRVWAFSEATHKDNVSKGLLTWGKDGKSNEPRKKRYLKNHKGVNTRSVWTDAGTNDDASKEFRTLFPTEGIIFDTPKPVKLIDKMLRLFNKDAMIFDFFAGSGTTAHAVMKLNKEDDGSRRYIMATLDEAVNPKSEAAKAGYKTIDEIARKRIDLAAEKLGDTSGCRHYRFVKPDIKILEQIEDFDPNTPKLVADDMLTPFSEKSLTGGTDERGVSTILTTWLVDDGYSFDTTAQELDLASYTAHYAPEIARLYLIEKDGWSKDACKALLNALGKNDIAVNAIVVYSYSFDFTSLTELKNNIKSNLDGKPQVIERY